MRTSLDEESETTPLARAVDDVAGALDRLIAEVDRGALSGLEASGLVGFLQAFETIRRTIPVIDHAAIQTGIDLGVPHTLCQRSMTRVLAQALQLSGADAGRRVRAARQLGDRRTATGPTLPPLRPHLAAAQRRGEISEEQAAVVDRGLRAVDHPGFDPADVEAGERILARQARHLGPAELAIATQAVVDRIDPDGSVPDDERLRQSRHLRMSRQADGSVKGEFHLTPEAGEKLKAVLDPLAAPMTTCLAGGTEEGGSQSSVKLIEADARSRGQRLHDALEQVCDRLLRSSGLPDSGGTPATAIVHLDLDDLLRRAGGGRLADGTRLSLAQVGELLDQAEIAWCLEDAKGAVLELGRSRRIATPAQTLAMIARDGGCSFPGCDVPPEWCERHHVVSWLAGGRTDLDNLTLLCRYHHRHFEQRGWTCRVNADRLPAWSPPRWIDREQRPIVHPRILLRRWKPQEPLPDAA